MNFSNPIEYKWKPMMLSSELETQDICLPYMVSDIKLEMNYFLYVISLYTDSLEFLGIVRGIQDILLIFISYINPLEFQAPKMNINGNQECFLLQLRHKIFVCHRW